MNPWNQLVAMTQVFEISSRYPWWQNVQAGGSAKPAAICSVKSSRESVKAYVTMTNQ